MAQRIDLVVVGAGTAGLVATKAALKAGLQVKLIEMGPGGTTCARVGCMPSKLLIAAAEYAHTASSGGSFGVHAEVRIDSREVMDRVRRERDRFHGFVLHDVDSLPKGVYVRGVARFVSDMTLHIEGEGGSETTIQADRIVLAVGSRPLMPGPLKSLGHRAIHNDELFDLEDLPSSVAVFGPGVIGLELGQALLHLGVRVRVFGLSGSFGPFTDPQIQSEAMQVIGRNLPVYPAVSGLRTRLVEEGFQVDWEQDGPRTEVFERALVAVGRISNLDGLNLEATSLPRTPRGDLLVDLNTLQVGEHPVFLAGDAAGLRPILHEAAHEGRIAGHNAVHFPNIKPFPRMSPLAIVFTHPQMIMVGQRHADLDPGSFVTGRISFDDQGRSRVMGLNSGALHLYAHRTSGHLLGAEGIGPRLEHLAHLLAWSHQQGLTIDQMLHMPFYHPVIEEGLRNALVDAKKQMVSPNPSRKAYQGRRRNGHQDP